MALSTEDAHIDVHPLTMPTNNEELVAQLRLFNDAQRQLLQAIRDDASEADLRAHLDCTLVNITDGGYEEQGNLTEIAMEDPAHGEVRLEPELRDILPRGRVYEKAFEEGRNNTRIEKFLLTELERDANLDEYLSLNLPDSRRLKIACWAAKCNFVHMVMALIRCRDEGDRDFVFRVLTIAVEFGYVELVEQLTRRQEFDVNGGRRMEDFDDMYLRESGNPIQTVDETGLTNRLTPLNLAAKLGNSEIVDTFLAPQRLERALSPEGYWALHWAVKMGHAEVVDRILLNKDINAAVLLTVEKSLIVHRLANDFAAVLMTVENSLVEHRLKNDFATSFRSWVRSRIGPFCKVSLTPPRSGIGPFCKISLTPPQLALFYGHKNVVKLLGDRLEHGTGLTDSATEMWRDEIREIVMDIPDIQKVVKRLEKERETFVQAANSIIIVAALIATVAFTVFLTPPPGYLATPRISVYAMYIYNSLSFFSAILTLLIGASVTRPQFRRTYIAVLMPLSRKLLFIAYNLLYFSVAFFMCTFLTAGYIVFQLDKVPYIVSAIMAVVTSVTAFLLARQAVSTPNTSFNFFLYCFSFSSLIVVSIIIGVVYYYQKALI